MLIHHVCEAEPGRSKEKMTLSSKLMDSLKHFKQYYISTRRNNSYDDRLLVLPHWRQFFFLTFWVISAWMFRNCILLWSKMFLKVVYRYAFLRGRSQVHQLRTGDGRFLGCRYCACVGKDNPLLRGKKNFFWMLSLHMSTRQSVSMSWALHQLFVVLECSSRVSFSPAKSIWNGTLGESKFWRIW